jgi:hypothetical protein
MASPDRSSPSGFPGSAGARAAINEDTIRTEKLQIERKTFVFSLKENPRGRFLRITEDVGGRRDTIIIPATGLEEFMKLVDTMAKQSADTPPPAQQP